MWRETGEVRRAMPPAWDILCKDGVREDLINWVTKAVEREAGQCHSGHDPGQHH